MPGFEWFGEEEKKEVNEVLDTGVLFRYGFEPARKGRWKAKSFEENLAEKVNAGYCHLVSSGTAALSVALNACKIGAGDEVIVPPFTFVATIESIIDVGAIPVFADIDETLCLDPESVRSSITEKTQAVIPVHMCGAMARIDELGKVCEESNLILIEDACQALGATFKNKAAGTFGKMGCFSFDPVKTVTCGEGGAVITSSEELYKLADAFSDHGHDHIGDDRGLEGHECLGTNFRISELNAAVGVAQLRKLDAMLKTQRKYKKIIKDELGKIDHISFRTITDSDGDSATFLSFFLPDEDRARKSAAALARAGVDGCFYWYDNNWHYIRKWNHLKNYQNLDLPVSDSIMSRTISMQIKLSWTEEDVKKRTETMINVLKGE